MCKGFYHSSVVVKKKQKKNMSAKSQHPSISQKKDNASLTAVMKLVPWGWRSSSFSKMEGELMEEGGVEGQRKDEGSLLL